MTALLHAHSGLRYVLLLVAVMHVVVSVLGQMKQAPVGKLHRALSGATLGLMHTQALIGLGLVAGGLYYPQLIGHLVMMVVAVGLATAMHVINKRADKPTHLRALMGTGGALVAMVLGLAAIGRHPLQSTSFGP